jgi:hypothetical protein
MNGKGNECFERMFEKNCKYKNNDKINLPFHIHVSGYGKGVT